MVEQKEILETNEKTTTNKFFAWVEEHPKTTFWARFVTWALFSCVLPFTFIVWRFKLFRAVSKIQVGGWGIIAIVIVAVFAFTVIKYIRMAMNSKHTLIGQVLGGFCKVIIPLCAVLAILYSIRNNVELMMQALGCVIICEAVAIPLNPLPKWAYECQKNVREEERKDTMDYLISEFFKKKKESESGGE